jgi:hypothetical protein
VIRDSEEVKHMFSVLCRFTNHDSLHYFTTFKCERLGAADSPDFVGAPAGGTGPGGLVPGVVGSGLASFSEKIIP